MLNFLKNLINLNSVLASKIQADRLFAEATAFSDAGEHRRAFVLMKQAADLGHQHAIPQLGIMFLKGTGTDCDWVQASNYLEQSSTVGDYKVQFFLGMIHGIGGWGVKRDIVRAEKHLIAARDLDGDPDAELLLLKLRKKQAPFGGKANPHPKISW